MKRIVSYSRVSTADQSCNMQRRDIRTYCEGRGLVLGQEYCDEGISGARSSRPGLDALLRDVRRRRVGVVIVWSLSRLGRSLKNLIAIVEEFESCGVTLVSLKEGWDLGTSTGRMIFQVMGALAEWEREQIRERVRGGLRAARARGKRLGRPCQSYDPATILELKEAGLSCRAIAGKVGVSHTTVRRVLEQNPPIPAALSA